MESYSTPMEASMKDNGSRIKCPDMENCIIQIII